MWINLCKDNELVIYVKTVLMLRDIFGIIFEQVDLDLNSKDKCQQVHTSLILSCLEKRLVIELDGGQHIDNHMYDTKRTDWLMTHGYKVLRFWNNDVFQQMPSILEVITSELLKSQ